jgi:hypothetical protein
MACSRDSTIGQGGAMDCWLSDLFCYSRFPRSRLYLLDPRRRNLAGKMMIIPFGKRLSPIGTDLPCYDGWAVSEIVGLTPRTSSMGEYIDDVHRDERQAARLEGNLEKGLFR